jgi:hypothetical protein
MASETNLPLRPKPKGILKKPTAPPPRFTAPPSTSPPPSALSSKQQDQDQNEDNQPPLTRAEILHKQEQAARLRLLQTLRDTELKPPIPLETFELLSHLPQTPSHPASSPSPADTTLFLQHLRDFQPSEYLDLIEERNCLNKCGYTLCPRPRRTHAGPFKLSAGSQSGIARTADLNKWCSDACALRALYLKVQLDNPSYVRSEGKMVVKLELREEKAKGGGAGATSTPTISAANTAPRGSEEDRNQLAQAMAQLEIDKRKQQTAKKGAALADERGDGGVFTGVSRVEVTIKENATDGPVQPPTLASGDAQLIEGYKPTLGKGKKTEARKSTGSDDDDDDDDDFFTVRF